MAGNPPAANPVAEPPTTAYAGENYKYAPVAVKGVTVFLIDGPPGMRVEDGVVSWTPSTNQTGEYRVVLDVDSASRGRTNVAYPLEVRPSREPSVAVTSQPEGILLQIPVRLAGIAVGRLDAELTAVEYRIDDGPWRRANGTDRWTVRLDPRQLSEGSHTMEVRAWSDARVSATVAWRFSVTHPFPVTAVLVATIPLTAALLTLAAALVSESVRFRLASLLVVPLYSRLNREVLLDNFTRGQVYHHVLSNPGDNYHAIRRSLGLSNGTLTYHLMVLQREGYVRSVRRSVWKHFYPADFPTPRIVFRLSPAQKAILETVRLHPGMGLRAVAREVGIWPNTAHHHLQRLSVAGMIRVERRGTRDHWYRTNSP